MPSIVLAVFNFAAVVAFPVELPVPPLAIGNVPVTPGVICALPSKFVLLVLAKFTLILLAFAKLIAFAVVMIKSPL